MIILANLLDNAIKYTAANGAIAISIFTHSQTVTLSIVDTGPGIPEDKLPYVTERFYRVPGHLQPGAGLGLTIAKRASEIIGANFILQNKAIGTGLEAILAFPLKH